MDFLVLIIGFVLLIKGADYFVEGSSSLAKILKVRHVPALTFVYDNQYEEEKKITDLLNKSQEDDQE